MFTIIALPDGFVASVTTYIGDIMTDLGPYLALVVGVILGTLVITILIDALRGHK